MTISTARSHFDSHDVSNQPPMRGDIDLWQRDSALRDAVLREGGQTEVIADYAVTMGRATTRTSTGAPPSAI